MGPKLPPSARALVLGTGGSLDCLAAYGVAQTLRKQAGDSSTVMYGNCDLMMDMTGWQHSGNAVRSLGLSHVIAVDVGGDALTGEQRSDPWRGQSWRRKVRRRKRKG